MTKLLDNCVGDCLILRKLAYNRNFPAAYEKPVHAVCNRCDIFTVERILRTKTLPCWLATVANLAAG